MLDKQIVKMTGVVIFLLSNEGSKSESHMPYLYRSKTEPLMPLLLKNDNPFENNGLTMYDGLKVDIVGEIGASGTCVVDEIKSVGATES